MHLVRGALSIDADQAPPGAHEGSGSTSLRACQTQSSRVRDPPPPTALREKRHRSRSPAVASQRARPAPDGAQHVARGEQVLKKLDGVFKHFQREFPTDPIQAFARFFAKRSHGACHGTGLLTYLRPADQPDVADLRLCGCARRRRDRFVSEAVRFDARGAAHSDQELALPVNMGRNTMAASAGLTEKSEASS
jgi:hypothetical protein